MSVTQILTHPAYEPVRQAIFAAHPRASKARDYKLDYAFRLIEGRPVKINRSYHNLIAHLVFVRSVLHEHGVLTHCAITTTHVVCKKLIWGA